ncbi:hypothetical protein CAPTEDRAFT_177369 [Capitella teleta]|uniref:Gfo/Idh/MocA-like oxidoreductase N-terminal domain-containing protein n=1 Tax=Capitella teleta TaxID=283909 RepID=R7U203_CAPTE|nr:hypothetical protein CAPTEDRAFT_177369 [Capitella teleta]|eukprot:ELT99892.1 hypothetical protein CAPTEDRAFT_177369 [Capitella teleta]
MGPLKAVVIGAGNRGNNYSDFALDEPDRLKVVAVAEPRTRFREKFAKKFSLAPNQVFKDWTEIAALDKMADIAIITTPDQLHVAPCLAFAKGGYHILLEKPMAVSYEDCKAIFSTCESCDVILAVCHVLRYTPQARKIKELIDSGVIGEVMNIQLLEPIGAKHFAHSYVRGNWRDRDTSAFSLLTKSCHDIDLISSFMSGSKCIQVSSFGSLQHFKPANKPTGAASRCLDCSVSSKCPYSAQMYLDLVQAGHTGWPVKVLHAEPDIENITEALRVGPYGQCVYEGLNDVCDNQVVNMQFDNGASVSFTMVAGTEKVCQRQVRVFGSKGELSCDFDSNHVRMFDFLSEERTKTSLLEEMTCAQSSRLSGHGGADFFTMESFVNAVENKDQSLVLTGPKESLLSHYLCFMAEKSRTENKIIQLTDAPY